MTRCLLMAAASLACLAATPVRAQAAPDVLASILPVWAITTSLMDGVSAPTLLLEPGASPHAFSLRPSQSQALASADLIVWVGPELERFLVAPIDTLGKDGRALALTSISGVEMLPFREGTLFAPESAGHDHGEHAEDAEHQDDHAHADDHAHEDDHAHGDDDHAHEADHAEHEHDDHVHGDLDPHVWLSPANARVMAAAIAAALGEIDAANAGLYAANLDAFNVSLDAVEAEIEAQLAPVRGKPFIVFHDGYRYFEEHFDIGAAGAVHLRPDVQPGAARIAELRQHITSLEAVCVFAEPQFEPRLIETLVEGTDARIGVLDPLGSSIAPGPDAYGQLLQDLATSLADCLEG